MVIGLLRQHAAALQNIIYEIISNQLLVLLTLLNGMSCQWTGGGTEGEHGGFPGCGFGFVTDVVSVSDT